jgi:hypothetical protein
MMLSPVDREALAEAVRQLIYAATHIAVAKVAVVDGGATG